MSMDLCSVCKVLLQFYDKEGQALAEPQWEWSIRYEGRSGHDLEAASDDGCRLCMQVWKSLDPREKAILFHEKSSGVACRVYWNHRDNKCGVLHIYFDADNEPEFYVVRRFEPFANTGLTLNLFTSRCEVF